MPDTVRLTLTGYRFSVYAWCARLACAEKAVGYSWSEVDPFTEAGQAALAGVHPFGRVPVLTHGAFRVYETAAIVTYLDATFDGPSLRPEAPEALARMVQVMGIVDSYAYQPLVRQVFAQGVFAPRAGVPGDDAVVREGLAEAGPVLAALEEIAAEGLVLRAEGCTLADCMLAPMISYFAESPQGHEMLGRHPHLARWFASRTARPAYVQSAPDLSRISEEVQR